MPSGDTDRIQGQKKVATNCDANRASFMVSQQYGSLPGFHAISLNRFSKGVEEAR